MTLFLRTCTRPWSLLMESKLLLIEVTYSFFQTNSSCMCSVPCSCDLGRHLGRFQRIEHKHRNCHRANPARYRRYSCSLLFDAFEINIACELRLAFRSHAYSVNAHIDHDNTFFDHVRGDRLGTARRHNKNVSPLGMERHILRCCVADCHCGVCALCLLKHHVCNRLSHNIAPAHNDHFRTFRLDTAPDQQLLNTVWCARIEVRLADNELTHIHRMERINVFVGINCIEHLSLIDVFGQR